MHLKKKKLLFMSPENKRKLWQEILKAGEFLEGKLPHSPIHPTRRNPYAHVASCIKTKFGFSYGELRDNQYEEVISYISFLKENPN